MAAFGGIPVLLGLVFIALGWFVGGHPHKSWVRATGTGLPWKVKLGPQPRYRYVDQTGVEHDGYTWFSNWPVAAGMPVPVIFDPDNPARSRMDSFVQKGNLFIVLGFMMVGLGVLLALLLGVLESTGGG